jgi:hypothetical protein
VKAAPFVYFAPETRAEAVALLPEHGDDANNVLVGGRRLAPMMAWPPGRMRTTEQLGENPDPTSDEMRDFQFARGVSRRPPEGA